MESTLTIQPWKRRARAQAISLLPEAVGPRRITAGAVSASIAFLTLVIAELVDRLLEMIGAVEPSVQHRLAAAAAALFPHLRRDPPHHRQHDGDSQEEHPRQEQETHLAAAALVKEQIGDHHPEEA